MMQHLRGRIVERFQRFDDHVVSVEGQRAAASLVVAAAMLLIPTFSAWQVAKAAAEAKAPRVESSAITPPTKEPLFSIRRIAQTAATEARIANVKSKLATLAAGLPQDSCLIVRTASRVVAQYRPNRPLVPASNMKLLVAAGALDALGADYRFSTVLLGNRVGDVIIGNVWLVGGGDPVLSTRAYPATQVYPTFSPTYLDTLADEVVALGITKITGSIVGDESRYDTERYVPTWGDGIRAIEAGPLGALMVDDGVLIGDPFKPANPAVGAATAFTRLLQSRGVTVIAAPRTGSAPANVGEISRLTSAPLGTLLGDLLANSDNNVAELLLKEIGLVGRQQPTRVAGLQVVAEMLTKRNISTEGAVFVDGSGLAEGNRVTCALLADLLESFGVNGVLATNLAVAGTTGTLREQLDTPPAKGRVMAKTGTLRNVKALSGFFPVDDGAMAFALILNGSGVSNQTAYQPQWRALMSALGAFSATPSTKDLLPR